MPAAHTSREIIRRVISRDSPPRIGFQFRKEGYPKDIVVLPGIRIVHPGYRETDWSRDPELLGRVPGFAGEVRADVWGNIWGRLDAVSKGECIRGVLEDGWDSVDAYELPRVDPAGTGEVRTAVARSPERYRMGFLPGMPFSLMRSMRKMETFLADMLLEEDRVAQLRDRLVAHLLAHVDANAEAGADSVYTGEDWGTQEALLVSPPTWRRLFKPAFAAVAARAHERGMTFIVHSCGWIWDIIPDLVEVGVDVLQVDQPALLGVERLGSAFGARVTFWSPVDIQQVMPTGNRELIEAEARTMIRELGSGGGGLIAADYTQWEALGVRDEWAEWARQVFLNEGGYRNGS
jgi:hypothetical protein